MARRIENPEWRPFVVTPNRQPIDITPLTRAVGGLGDTIGAIGQRRRSEDLNLGVSSFLRDLQQATTQEELNNVIAEHNRRGNDALQRLSPLEYQKAISSRANEIMKQQLAEQERERDAALSIMFGSARSINNLDDLNRMRNAQLPTSDPKVQKLFSEILDESENRIYGQNAINFMNKVFTPLARSGNIEKANQILTQAINEGVLRHEDVGKILNDFHGMFSRTADRVDRRNARISDRVLNAEPAPIPGRISDAFEEAASTVARNTRLPASALAEAGTRNISGSEIDKKWIEPLMTTLGVDKSDRNDFVFNFNNAIDDLIEFALDHRPNPIPLTREQAAVLLNYTIKDKEKRGVFPWREMFGGGADPRKRNSLLNNLLNDMDSTLSYWQESQRTIRDAEEEVRRAAQEIGRLKREKHLTQNPAQKNQLELEIRNWEQYMWGVTDNLQKLIENRHK